MDVFALGFMDDRNLTELFDVFFNGRSPAPKPAKVVVTIAELVLRRSSYVRYDGKIYRITVEEPDLNGAGLRPIVTGAPSAARTNSGSGVVRRFTTPTTNYLTCTFNILATYANSTPARNAISPVQ
jgi:hypothetical protein